VALATLLDGGIPAFADRMNARMAELGLVDTYFVEPSGLSPRNLITARSFARFLVAHLQRFPDAVDRFYSVRTYTYPDGRHRVATTARQGITQSNRNSLLWNFQGADGLKTGFIDESGYHLAATAVRDGRRLIAIVLGIDADSHASGGLIRATEASALLEYGFNHFRRVRSSSRLRSPCAFIGGGIRS
jgi:serine-type D-Ala-D-Ala carboxypeptidase (penicillin-binding protein 5/6)